VTYAYPGSKIVWRGTQHVIGCGPSIFAQLLVDALNRIVENAIASSVCIGRPFPSAVHGLDGENERHLFPACATWQNQDKHAGIRAGSLVAGRISRDLTRQRSLYVRRRSRILFICAQLAASALVFLLSHRRRSVLQYALDGCFRQYCLSIALLYL